MVGVVVGLGKEGEEWPPEGGRACWFACADSASLSLASTTWDSSATSKTSRCSKTSKAKNSACESSRLWTTWPRKSAATR